MVLLQKFVPHNLLLALRESYVYLITQQPPLMEVAEFLFRLFCLDNIHAGQCPIHLDEAGR
jgi:hypothetical protein